MKVGWGGGGVRWSWVIKGYKDFKDCFLWTKTSLVSLAAVLSRHATLFPNLSIT